MNKRALRLASAVLLTVALTLTGIVAASARGQVRAGGEVLVLCSAGGPVQLTRDAGGRPTGGSHLCPDLAPGLLSALDLGSPVVVRPDRAGCEPAAFANTRGTGRHQPGASARGPPLAA